VNNKPTYRVNQIGISIGEPSKTDRTYVIAGVERGGTSPVAGAARVLGLYLGDGLHMNNEDPLFAHRGYHQTIETIKQRNSTHSVWGWKFPKAFLDLPLYVEHLRNPHLVVVFRDPVSAAMGHHKWSGTGIVKPTHFHLSEAQAYNSLNLTHALTSGMPGLLISYEKWLNNTAAGIDELAKFLRLKPPTKTVGNRLLEYLQGGSYKDFKKFFASD
jgi:hypothetical protein